MVPVLFRGHEYGGIRRDHWRRHTDRLDPSRDFVEIYRTAVGYEFPWDFTQALSLALFRTYAVPEIGTLLDHTGEFTQRTQRRHDDTALLLEPPGRVGFDDPEARTAVRRINQMHHRYDIPDHQLRYVLSTFVVVPKRWLDVYGKRPLTDHEVQAVVEYYRAFGRRMAIPDIPETYQEFEALCDGYEIEHFGYSPGGRRVAEATLALLVGFFPRPLAPAVRAFSLAVMDPPLLRAFGFEAPHPLVIALSRSALRLRGRALRWFPARRTAVDLRRHRRIRSYPDGFDVALLGTFPVAEPSPGDSVETGEDVVQHRGAR